MRENLDLPTIPEYIPIKDAAKMLGVSDKRVYAYIEEGRLPAVRAAHIIMLPIEEVKKFKPRISGRPRKRTPMWRSSPDDNKLLTTSICVHIKPNQEKGLQRQLAEIRQSDEHIFPGTIARYIITSESRPGNIEIILIWRSSTIPDEVVRKQALDMFQQKLADVLDWKSARYEHGEVLLHT